MFSFKSLVRLTWSICRYVFTVMKPEFAIDGLTLRFIAQQFVSELGALEFSVMCMNAERYFLWCNEWWMNSDVLSIAA